MKFLFQMDDPKKININEDSTYMLIKESLNRGIECYYNDPRWVFSEINKVNKIKSHVSRLSLKKNNHLSYQRKILKEIDLEHMNAIFIRQDPPFDLNYISNTYLLDQLKKPLILNNSKEIRNFPEKHIMMNFPELTPPTLSSFFSVAQFVLVNNPLGFSSLVISEKVPLPVTSSIAGPSHGFTPKITSISFDDSTSRPPPRIDDELRGLCASPSNAPVWSYSVPKYDCSLVEVLIK